MSNLFVVCNFGLLLVVVIIGLLIRGSSVGVAGA
jgi:hypothetical protein